MKTIKTLLLCFLLAHAAGAAEKGEKPEPPAATSIAELETQLRAILDETKTPGLGVALVDREKTIWAAGLGLADVATGREATAETLFRIGSVSKGFASLAVLALVEQGKLSLDDTVRSLAPEIAFENRWEATDPVRLVHVLEHTAGFDDIHLKEYALQRPGISIADALAYHPRSRTSRWRPGTRMSYCNSGPPIAARIVEIVTGQPFDQFVAERFFAPLGMTTASYFLTPEVERRLTKLYHPDGKTPYPYWHVGVWPSGSINASPAEMANYVRFYLGRGTFGGRQLFSTASIERMERAQSSLAARAGMELGYGLSNYTTPAGGFVWHGHNGGVEGGLASLAYLPVEGVGYVFLTNSGSVEAFGQIEERIRAFLTRGLTPLPIPPAGSVPAEIAARWSGSYLPDTPRQELMRWAEQLFGGSRIEIEAGKLTVRPLLGETRAFVPITARLFRQSDPEDEGRVSSLALLEEGGMPLIQVGPVVMRKVSPLRLWSERLGLGLCGLVLLSSPLFAITALVLAARRRVRGRRALVTVAAPVLAVLFVGLAFALLAASDDDLLARFGNATVWSIGLCLSTFGFAVLAVVGLLAARKAGDGTLAGWMRRWALALSLAASGLAAYLGYWGWIGVRTWT